MAYTEQHYGEEQDCDFYAESNVAMSNQELDDLTKSIENEHPLSGERIIIGILRT